MKKTLTMLAAAMMATLCLFGCGAKGNAPLRADAGKKPKMLWLDAEANFARFASQDSIRYYLDKTVESGFNWIVVDVKPVEGDVLYNSDHLTHLTVMHGDTVKRDWDYLQYFLDQAKLRNLKVSVSVATFAAGLTQWKEGPAFRDSTLNGRINLEYYPKGMMDMRRDTVKGIAFLNPAMPENQAYALGMIREILTKYKFDGFILDYCRYSGFESDFSQFSRADFEKYIGAKVEHFPQDIFTYAKDGNRVPGKYYKQWWEYRSTVIHDFVAQVRKTVDELQPDVQLQYWAGSWLHAIYVNGQNWGSPRSNFSQQPANDWATPTYAKTGFADQLNTFITGTYLDRVWGKDDPESIEFGLARSIHDVEGDCSIYGSLYAQNHLAQFSDAVYLCLTRTEGVMVFDIVQVIQHNLWSAIKSGIDRAESEPAGLPASTTQTK